MKTKGQRQSRNIVDLRVSRNINLPVANNVTSAPHDPTVVSVDKMRRDRLRAVMSTSAPVLALYNDKKRAK